jgi:putative oxygen-independent coproporphyrinogen III oxidase
VKAGLYLHIPFCKTKCNYCDFFSIPDFSQLDVFIELLQQEIELINNLHPLYDTLYLGGGTPSLLTVAHLEILFPLLREFRFTADAEITLEANPDDVTPEKLLLWKELGINRLSLGVQSLNETELRFLGRRHNASQALKALKWARKAGFDNLGVDLMYALPGQNQADWLATLEAVLTFEPEHLSCYQLTIEEHTLLGKKQARGEFEPATEEQQRAFFLLTSEFLENKGYCHYEISNYARGKRHISRHNTKYWQHAPYLGLGPAAHSFDGQIRRWNVRSVEEYCRLLQEGRAPTAGSEILTATQLHLESLCLGLRTRQGIALTDLTHFPQADKTLASFVQAGLLQVEQGRALPTTEGFLVADSLALMLSE